MPQKLVVATTNCRKIALSDGSGRYDIAQLKPCINICNMYGPVKLSYGARLLVLFLWSLFGFFSWSIQQVE